MVEHEVNLMSFVSRTCVEATSKPAKIMKKRVIRVESKKLHLCLLCNRESRTARSHHETTTGGYVIVRWVRLRLSVYRESTE